MKRCLLSFILVVLAAGVTRAGDIETIVLIRHGEKPTDREIGQLNCQGLNRALALAEVLPKKYPNPQFIFGPGTTDKASRDGVEVSYLRPLITIAPTAIRLGMA